MSATVSLVSDVVRPSQRRLTHRGCALAQLAVATWLLGACGDDGGGSGDTDGGDATGAEGSTGVVAGDGGEVLGCPAGQTCDLVLVSQTLDDRVEVFSPADPAGVVYRGAIDIDLKPNTCEGCEPGDNSDGRLDEPYGLAIAGGHLHVVTGHYPMSASGSLVSFPFDFFADRAAGATIPVTDYFDGAAFTGVVSVPLGELEPIFVTAVGDKLLLGVFNNDLFATEDTWTQSGKLAIIDAADPGGGFGIADLGGLDGGGCNGAAQVITLDDGRIAVACDGNEGVAVLQIDALDGTPTEAAGSVTGQVCSIPGSLGSKRVRHLASDGSGGFVVLEGPGPNVLDDGKLWWFDGDCGMQGLVTLDGMDWQLTQVVALPQWPATWLFASGAASPAGNRGIYVAEGAGGQITVCGPLPGFDALLSDDAGDPLEPQAIALDPGGTHLAVGTGPFVAPSAGPGFGRVGWATLSGTDGADPCAITASVTDLTAGPPGAPAVDPADPLTFRRSPAVVEIVRVSG